MDEPKPVSWQCPRCLRSVDALADNGLFWQVRNHIKEHEAEAVRQAASLNGAIIKDAEGFAILSRYDTGFLKTLRISW